MTNNHLPTIGLVCPTSDAEDAPSPGGYTQKYAYVAALVRGGAVPLLLPQLADTTLLRAMYEKVSGLVLAGGGDIDPAHYGEAIHEKCGPIVAERDEMELALTCWAIEDGKPVLAICRGIQVLNVALGGTLYQDIQAQVPGALQHWQLRGTPPDHHAHTVAVEPFSLLSEILGTTPLQVNSRHHQAIRDLAPGVSIAASAPDEVIEAVEVAEHPFALGVQWHPEDLAAQDPRAQSLFDALIESCR